MAGLTASPRLLAYNGYHKTEENLAATQKKPMKSRYTLNFAKHMAQCETNYAQLLKLMPQWDSSDSWIFAVDAASHVWKMRIEVLERTRYTTTVSISRQDTDEHPWLQLPNLTVRLYHDASIAEVLAWNNHKKLQVRYKCPNKDMYHADEKIQLNRFLGEWLALCLTHGHSLQPVVLKGS